MDRLAIIIKGFSKNDTELQTDRKYVNLYLNFIQSTAGGAWNIKNEILVLEDPDISDLEGIIDKFFPEFILLIMIGHGATQKSKQLFQINETTVIRAGQLALDVKKQLVILESCRTRINSKIATVDLKDRIPKFKYGGVIRSPITREESRKIYLSQLQNCPDGLVVCYPCDVNEVASNYHFSFALLRRAFEWHLLNYNKYFPINELMGYVTIDVEKITKKKQRPTINGNIKFPFAISKF